MVSFFQMNEFMDDGVVQNWQGALPTARKVQISLEEHDPIFLSIGYVYFVIF